MLQLLHFRLKVMTVDGRVFVGQMLAFDRYMNLVLSECEEFRKIKPKKGSTAKEREEKRALGLIVLRGETIVSLSVEGPPTSAEKKMRGPAVQGLTPLVGPGVGRPAGRGIPAAAPGVAPAGTQSPFNCVFNLRSCWTCSRRRHDDAAGHAWLVIVCLLPMINGVGMPPMGMPPGVRPPGCVRIVIAARLI